MADKPLCSILNCGNPRIARGYCASCYKRIIQKDYKRPPTPPCSVANCGRMSHGRGYCLMHLKRVLRHGNPLGGRTPRGDVPRFLEATRRSTSSKCITWPYAKNSQGSAQFRVRGRTMNVCRWMCEQRYGNPPTPQHEAAHLCGNGHESCVNPNHLVWATPAENQSHKLIHDTHKRGSRTSKNLTEEDVKTIRRLAREGVSQASLARQHRVSNSAIYSIRRRITWAWLED